MINIQFQNSQNGFSILKRKFCSFETNTFINKEWKISCAKCFSVLWESSIAIIWFNFIKIALFPHTLKSTNHAIDNLFIHTISRTAGLISAYMHMYKLYAWPRFAIISGSNRNHYGFMKFLIAMYKIQIITQLMTWQ